MKTPRAKRSQFTAAPAAPDRMPVRGAPPLLRHEGWPALGLVGAALLTACTSSALVGINLDAAGSQHTDGPGTPAFLDASAPPLLQDGPTAEPAPAPQDAANAEAAAPVQLCETPAQPFGVAVLQPGPEGKDARIMSLPSEASRPHPEDVTVTAQGWTWLGEPGVVRALIGFDLSTIPATAIESATLTLYGDARADMPPYYFGHERLDGVQNDGWLLRVLEPWEEATATWLRAPMTAAVPQSASSVDATNAVYLPASSTSDQTYVLDVTAMISGMIKGTFENHGFLLRVAVEEHYRSLSFYSSDYNEPQLRPKLTVTYRRPGC